jgi:hypothetical protein
MCFDFCFSVVLYRGHIIAQYKNMCDIADIYGDRNGAKTSWIPHKFHRSTQKQLDRIEGPIQRSTSFGTRRNGWGLANIDFAGQFKEKEMIEVEEEEEETHENGE